MSSTQIIGGLVASLMLVGCGAANEQELRVAHAETTGPWGAASRGLRLRLTIPARLEQGLPIRAKLEACCDLGSVPQGVRHLNTFRVRDRFSLHFARPGTSDALVIARPLARNPSPPPCDDGRSMLPLESHALEPWDIELPLVNTDLKPGSWDCRAEFTSPETSQWWLGSDAAWAAWGVWRGTVTSDVCRIDIVEATPKVRDCSVPRELRLARMDPYVVVTYRATEADWVRLPVQNGFTLGLRAYVSERARRPFVCRPYLPSGDPLPIDELDDYQGGDLDRTYLVQIFETPVAPSPDWQPECGDFKILWKRSLRILRTERDVKELLGR